MAMVLREASEKALEDARACVERSAKAFHALEARLDRLTLMTRGKSEATAIMERIALGAEAQHDKLMEIRHWLKTVEAEQQKQAKNG